MKVIDGIIIGLPLLMLAYLKLKIIMDEHKDLDKFLREF